jgi:hypothetical protein
MIFEACNASRRWMTVTVCAKRNRKVAFSIAESPPPATAMCRPQRKKPSPAAHHETPCPDSSFSLDRPGARYAEPVARITVSAQCVLPEWFLTAPDGEQPIPAFRQDRPAEQSGAVR